MKKIFITLSIVLSLGLIWVALSMNSEPATQGLDVVRIENNTQYIRILARGGYSPKQINATANMPTVLEIETKGTYDCSAALTIPKLGYSQFLPPSGVTKVEVPKNQTSDSLDLTCSMGMYNSVINFNS